MRTFWLSASIAGLVMAYSAACQDIDGFDLTLISANVVTQQQIPRHDKSWDEGVITAPLVRVDFSVKVDLQALARRGEYNIDNVTSLCGQYGIDRGKKISGFPDVLDYAGRVDEYRPGSPTTANGPADQSHVYHVYFDVKQSGIYGFLDYDLVQKPSDICIVINGTTEHEFGYNKTFASRTLVVPKALLLKAISDAGVH